MKILVEINKPPAGEGPSEVFFHLDDEGLRSLMQQLHNLKEKKTDHIHLMSPSWGMAIGGLSEEKADKDNYLAHHLKIQMAS